MDLEISRFNLAKENANPNGAEGVFSPSKEGYKQALAESLFDGKMEKASKVLAFKQKAPEPKEHQNVHKVLYSANKFSTAQAKPKTTRFIAKNPERVLDAPNLLNDYYLNLIDWSNQNTLAIALANTVYLWNASTGGIVELLKTSEDDNVICSVNWTKEGRCAHHTPSFSFVAVN